MVTSLLSRSPRGGTYSGGLCMRVGDLDVQIIPGAFLARGVIHFQRRQAPSTGGSLVREMFGLRWME